MLGLDNILFLMGTLLAALAVGILYRHYRRMILPEIYLLFAGLVLVLCFFIGFIPTLWLDQIPPDWYPPVLFLPKLGFVLALLGLFLLCMAVYLPSFKGDYRSVGTVVVISMVYATAIISAFYNFEVSFLGMVEIVFHPLTFAFSSLGFLMVPGILIYRSSRIKKMVDRSGSFFDSNLGILVYGLVSLLFFLVILILELDPGFELSISLIMIPGLLSYLVFCYALYTDQSFLFITDISWEEFLIIHRHSGIILHDTTFTGEANRLLVGGLLGTINTSLQEQLNIEQDISSIAFASKQITMSTGRDVIGLMIVNGKSLLTGSLCSYLVAEFERNYGQVVASGSDVVDTSNFRDFEHVIALARNYMPL